MSREIRRVPLDFDYPRGKVWAGYLSPDKFNENQCRRCEGDGMSPLGRHLRERWYGNVPFDPAETGSTPFTPETPEIRAMAERHCSQSPEFYGTGEWRINHEARRLADLFNGAWSHHLSQEDVDVLVAAERLYAFTHTWVRGEGWKPIEPTPTVTAEQVNRWSIAGQNNVDLWPVLKATCERAGKPVECMYCDGHGSFEAYPGQRAEAEAWEPTEPPVGAGYQLWETVSEGSPQSPVFAKPKNLANWIKARGSEFDGRDTPYSDLVNWIQKEGSSFGSFIRTGTGETISGVEAAARLGGLDE